MIAPVGRLLRKPLVSLRAESLMSGFSREMYFFPGKAIRARVDLPLCLGPVNAMALNWVASFFRTASASRIIMYNWELDSQKYKLLFNYLKFNQIVLFIVFQIIIP